MKHAWFLAACAVGLSGCGSSSYVRLRSVSPLNVNDANESAPVDVRVYQLKDDGRFTRARVEDLWTKDSAVLGDDLLAQTKVTVFPGPARTGSLDVEMGPLPPECRFIGVLALFSKPDDKGPRHLAIPAQGARGRVILLSGSHLELQD